MTYLITFSFYGTHLRGDERGSVDRRQAAPGLPLIEPNPRQVAANRLRMNGPVYRLDEGGRAVVIASIHETCAIRGWGLLAAHARTEHVHAVIYAKVSPEAVVRDLKAYASRRLNERGPRVEKRWTRRASTRWLRSRESVMSAVRYVAEGQGEPMAAYVAEEFSAPRRPMAPCKPLLVRGR